MIPLARPDVGGSVGDGDARMPEGVADGLRFRAAFEGVGVPKELGDTEF